MDPIKIFGREQAAWFAMIAGVFQVLAAYSFDVDGTFQGIATAVVVFVFAVVLAVRSGDGILALASGITVALGSLFTALGLDWAAEHQANVLGLITVVGGFVLRKYLVAPVPGIEVSSHKKLTGSVNRD
jgi:hypothetical protein